MMIKPHLGPIAIRLSHQVQPVESTKPDVGDEQIERFGGQQVLRTVVRRRAGHEISHLAKHLDDAFERCIVVIQDEDLIGQLHGSCRERAHQDYQDPGKSGAAAPIVKTLRQTRIFADFFRKTGADL